MDLFVVMDTKGAGRLLGVFDSRKRADQFVQAYPSYYQLYCCRLNQVNTEVIDWADDDDQRKKLEKLIDG